MKTIVLRFTKSSTWDSRLVRWYTGFWASHVEILWDLEHDLYVGSEITRGVDFYNSSEELEWCEYCFVRVTEKQERIFNEFVLSKIGHDYDILALIGNMFKRNWQSSSDFFCSELIAEGLDEAGVTLIDKRNNRITPEDIWNSERVVNGIIHL